MLTCLRIRSSSIALPTLNSPSIRNCLSYSDHFHRHAHRVSQPINSELQKPLSYLTFAVHNFDWITAVRETLDLPSDLQLCLHFRLSRGGFNHTQLLFLCCSFLCYRQSWWFGSFKPRVRTFHAQLRRELACFLS